MNMFKASLLGSSIMLVLSTIPTHASEAGAAMVNPQSGVVVGYWHNWCGGAGYKGGVAPCITLDKINPQYNVVDISFMKVYDTSNPIPTFQLDPEIGMSETQFIDQIAELNRQGRSVLLALGGADAHIELRTGQEQAFADEIIRLVERYGFDGLDIDLEQAAITAANNQTVIPAALRMVKDHYRTQGKNFLITMAPEFPYLTAGGAYIPYITALEGYYDWINPQFYNQGGDGIYIEGIGWIAQNNDALKKEFIYYISDSLINGTRGFTKIPHDKLVFGIPSSNDAAATGYISHPQDLFDAFASLKQQGQPLRGVMTWSINWDMGKSATGQAYSESFIKTYGPFIHDQNITPPVPDNGKPIFTGIDDTRVKQGAHFDPMADVTAYDKEDDDLTSQIQVEGSVNTQRIGIYPLTYKVSDSDENITEKLRQVTVYNMKPVFTGISDTTLELGAAFDPRAGITAHDEEDGDLTDKIQITGDIDTQKIGRYTLNYRVTDSAAQNITQSRTITVKEQGATCDNNWITTQVYIGGDVVSYNGKTWRAEWWNQGEEPGSTGEWGVWRNQGDSDCGNGGQPPEINGEFTVSDMAKSYPLVNGKVRINFSISTNSTMTINTTLEQAGHIYGSNSQQINGSKTLVLEVDKLNAGTHEIVIRGITNESNTTEQRFAVQLTAEESGGDYPAYQAGFAYQGGDKVIHNGGNVYECKPFPYSGWCSGSSSHYAPGTGSSWQDAWIAR